jgi:hypothetical protein
LRAALTCVGISGGPVLSRALSPVVSSGRAFRDWARLKLDYDKSVARKHEARPEGHGGAQNGMVAPKTAWLRPKRLLGRPPGPRTAFSGEF